MSKVIDETRRGLYITTPPRSEFLPTPIRMTLNDLEYPIQLKVRFAHGLMTHEHMRLARILINVIYKIL